ncbi:MAG: VWA domain-containing protein [Flavobacteriales bacterium]|nr:VWA domain-containing protein [Flavobacteriales bacterium]
MNKRKLKWHFLLAFVFQILMLIILWWFLGMKKGNGLQFLYPYRLFGLLLLPVFHFLYYRREINYEKIHRYLSHPGDSAKLFPRHNVVKSFLVNMAFAFLIIGLSMPYSGATKSSVNSLAKEFVFCLDVSNSMNVRDIQNESRLEVAKRSISAILERSKDDLFSLCIFAGNAHEEVTLTNDYRGFKLRLEDANSSLVMNQGTDIAQALAQCLRQFSRAPSHKTIILITDGENHEIEDSEIFEKIKSSGIGLVAIGLGTEKGGPIPTNPKAPGGPFKRDQNGFTINSALSKQYIFDVANRMNGTAIIVNVPYPDLKSILTEINQISKHKSRNLNVNIKSTYYQYAVFIALLCLLIWIFWTKKKLIV